MSEPPHARSPRDARPPHLPEHQGRRGPSHTDAGGDKGLGCLIGLLVAGVAALFLVSLAVGIGVVLWFQLAAPAMGEARNAILARPPQAADGEAAGGEPVPRDGKDHHAIEPAAPPRAVLPITGDPEMDRLLFDLEAPDGAMRKAATDRLVAMKPNQHRAVVAKKLAQQLLAVEPFEREPLIRALSVWATAAEVPRLIQLLDSPEINIRNVTLDALGKLRDERAVKPVVRCFREHNTRWHSEQALRALGPMAEKEVLALLEQPDRGLWTPAIYVLADIGTERSLPALRKASKQFETQGVAEGAIVAIRKRLKKQP